MIRATQTEKSGQGKKGTARDEREEGSESIKEEWDSNVAAWRTMAGEEQSSVLL